jgi:transcriptional regulator with XRE-family HTH domain
MLPNEQIKDVMRLLGEGRHSQRQIAKLTGVSRIVIHRIASGKRKLRPVTENTTWDEDRYKRPFERCPVCGGLVQLPCIECIVKRLPKAAAFGIGRHESLQLALEDEHRKRYIKVKKWRLRQDDPDFTVLPEEWPFKRKPPIGTVTKNENR